MWANGRGVLGSCASHAGHGSDLSMETPLGTTWFGHTTGCASHHAPTSPAGLVMYSRNGRSSCTPLTWQSTGLVQSPTVTPLLICVVAMPRNDALTCDGPPSQCTKSWYSPAAMWWWGHSPDLRFSRPSSNSSGVAQKKSFNAARAHALHSARAIHAGCQPVLLGTSFYEIADSVGLECA